MTQQEPAHYKELHLQGLKHVFFFLVFHEMFDRNLHFKALRRLLVLDEKLKKKNFLHFVAFSTLIFCHNTFLFYHQTRKILVFYFPPAKLSLKLHFMFFFLSLIYCIHSHALLSSTQAISTKKNSRPVTYMYSYSLIQGVPCRYLTTRSSLRQMERETVTHRKFLALDGTSEALHWFYLYVGLTQVLPQNRRVMHNCHCLIELRSPLLYQDCLHFIFKKLT